LLVDHSSQLQHRSIPKTVVVVRINNNINKQIA
jgi:hypothetical protein